MLSLYALILYFMLSFIILHFTILSLYANTCSLPPQTSNEINGNRSYLTPCNKLVPENGSENAVQAILWLHKAP